jgi:hypothetical protein
MAQISALRLAAMSCCPALFAAGDVYAPGAADALAAAARRRTKVIVRPGDRSRVILRLPQALTSFRPSPIIAARGDAPPPDGRQLIAG